LPPPEQAVTIGVGFRCVDGVVIAADTQYTRGVAYKTQGPKLFQITQRDDLVVIAAGAGTVPYMKRAAEKIGTALQACKIPQLEEVRVITEAALVDFFKVHVYPSPSANNLGFTLILGVWTKADGFGLFTSTNTTVTPITEADADSCTIGTGFPVADFALGLTHQFGINGETAKLIAAFCIKGAKDYSDHCGGKTHIWTLTGDHTGCRLEKVIPVDVDDAEQYAADLFDTIKVMLTLLDPESTLDDSFIGDVVGAFKEGVLDFRQKQIDRRVRSYELKAKREAYLAKARAKRNAPTV